MIGCDFRNQILNSFSPAAQEQFCLKATLENFEAGEHISVSSEMLFLVEQGYLSMPVDDGKDFELASFGNEGMAGVEHLFSASEPRPCVWVTEGIAWSISAAALTTLIANFPGLERIFASHLGAHIEHLCRQTQCFREHSAEKRLITSVLATSDRCGKTFTIQQDSFHRRLDISKHGVQSIVSKLAHANLLTHHRGKFSITNRANLESMACPCYRTFADEQTKFLRLNATNRIVGFGKPNSGLAIA